MIRKIVVIASALALQGCLAVIPGSAVSAAQDAITGEEGGHCVPAIAKIGDRVQSPDGRIGTITKLETSSTRCASVPGHPVRALLSFT